MLRKVNFLLRPSSCLDIFDMLSVKIIDHLVHEVSQLPDEREQKDVVDKCVPIPHSSIVIWI